MGLPLSRRRVLTSFDEVGNVTLTLKCPCVINPNKGDSMDGGAQNMPVLECNCRPSLGTESPAAAEAKEAAMPVPLALMLPLAPTPRGRGFESSPPHASCGGVASCA